MQCRTKMVVKTYTLRAALWVPFRKVPTRGQVTNFTVKFLVTEKDNGTIITAKKVVTVVVGLL